MHLLDLGIGEKLLNIFIDGPNKLSNNKILQLSQRLMNLNDSFPSEFQRSTRSLGEINNWKSNEFGIFLKYYGPFVLLDILSEDMLKHFNLFYVSCRLLNNDELRKKYSNNAREYFKKFFGSGPKYYGVNFLTLNTFTLNHVCDDEYFNCPLNQIIAHCFVNE